MSASLNQNYYEILNISKSATGNEITKAYRKLAPKCHPDRASQNNMTKEVAEAKFKLLNEAYNTLSDQMKRQIYDFKNSTQQTFPFFKTSSSYSAPFRESPLRDKKVESLHPIDLDNETLSVIDTDDCQLLEQHITQNNYGDKILKTILYYACKKGKLHIVQFLINVKKLPANLIVAHCLLHTGSIFKAAAESGNLDLVKYLLEVEHADIESQGLTPGTLNTALSRSTRQGHVDVVAYLISKGANVNPKISDSNILNEAIELKKVEIVKMLIESGTKMKQFHMDRAFEIGILDIVKYLLFLQPGIKNHHFYLTPACSAVISGNVELVKYLEDNENLDLFEKHRYKNDSTLELLKAGAKSSSIEMMKFLLDEKGLLGVVLANPKYTEEIIILAATQNQFLPTREQIQNQILFMQFLMEEKHLTLSKEVLMKIVTHHTEFCSIEMNSYLQSYICESEHIRGMLIYIAINGLEGLNLKDLLKLHHLKIIKRGKFEYFQREIHCHIDSRKIKIEELRELFIANPEIMTDALFYYTTYHFKDNLAPLQLLVELGVDLNSENFEGIAAIHLAMQSGGDNTIVQFFLNHHVDLTKRNKQGKTFTELLESRNFKF